MIERPKELEKQSFSADVDRCLAGLKEEVRGALERLRTLIHEAAPQAVEVISYRMPAFKHLGMLVGFAAYRDHCSFFLMSTTVMKDYQDELKKFEVTKSAIHFTPDKPLPARLVRKLVKARIRENEAHAAQKKFRRKSCGGQAGKQLGDRTS
jgi:uncharacterized protein YdhG (YjbR/CyaY superfamily)